MIFHSNCSSLAQKLCVFFVGNTSCRNSSKTSSVILYEFLSLNRIFNNLLRSISHHDFKVEVILGTVTKKGYELWNVFSVIYLRTAIPLGFTLSKVIFVPCSIFIHIVTLSIFAHINWTLCVSFCTRLVKSPVYSYHCTSYLPF